MTHSFQFDPSAILGVPPGSSLREIRDAYHQKSLKYHPDKGGDEWAFRVVTQAYEILSTARVVNRASEDDRRPTPTRPESRPEPEAQPKATWTNEFGPSSAKTGVNPDSTLNVKGWGGPARSDAGESPDEVAKIVMVELLILRFELECSLSNPLRQEPSRGPQPEAARSHVFLAGRRAGTSGFEVIPDAAKIVKKIGEAFKVKGVRSHSLKKKSSVEHGRFERLAPPTPRPSWPPEALEAFRGEALAQNGLELEKQVREMAIPRPRG